MRIVKKKHVTAPALKGKTRVIIYLVTIFSLYMFFLFLLSIGNKYICLKQKISIPFEEIQHSVFKTLTITPEILSKKHGYIKIDRIFSKDLYEVYEIFILDYNENDSLSFSLVYTYDLASWGNEKIDFTLKKTDDETTTISINYRDFAVGLWPPFIIYNPGVLRERSIYTDLFLKNTKEMLKNAHYFDFIIYISKINATMLQENNG